jgi:hypothetical protein
MFIFVLPSFNEYYDKEALKVLFGEVARLPLSLPKTLLAFPFLFKASITVTRVNELKQSTLI